MRIRFIPLLTGAIGAIALSMPAFAIPFGSNNVYKAMQNGVTSVYVSGTPTSITEVNLGQIDKATARLAGACGEVRISPPSGRTLTTLKVNGISVDVSTLPTQLLPSCTNGQFAESRTANFKTSSGQAVIVGFQPNQAVNVEIPTQSVRRLTLNGCGFAILRATSSSPLPTSFSIGSTSYTVASLPDAGNPPICRTSGSISQGYVPANWP